MIRLDKFISNNSHFSRSDVRRLVRSQAVLINSEIAQDPGLRIQGSDQVIIDGKPLKPIGDIYLMLHKPKGVVCANHDSEYPTVIDLLTNEKNYLGQGQNPYTNLAIEQLQIAGRLDLNTSGLVLITNNGQWNHLVTSPNTQCRKRYLVSLARPIDEHTPKLFAEGVLLEGEKHRTRPAFIETLTPTKVRLSISEGKYHQVKRMFAAAGNRVEDLHRESIGNIHLDPLLGEGHFRALTSDEVSSIRSSTAMSEHA